MCDGGFFYVCDGELMIRNSTHRSHSIRYFECSCFEKDLVQGESV